MDDVEPNHQDRHIDSALQRHRDGNVDIERVVRLELDLLLPAVRADPALLEAVLHADFIEHGSSGRIWTRQAIIDELPLEGATTPRTTALDVDAQHLTEDTILVTYRTTSAIRNAVRSSVWLRLPDGDWQIRFHQGTPVS